MTVHISTGYEKKSSGTGGGEETISTSTIMVPTGDQDPTFHLNQSFWMTVAPLILVANQI